MARGYIRKRGTNRRQLTWDVPRGPGGKRKQRYETVRGAKKQTQARITEIEHALNHGTYAEPSKVVLLGDYLDQWHDESSKNHRPKTAERHEEMVRSHHYRLRIAPDAPTDTPRPQDWVCVRPDGTPIRPQTLSQGYDRIAQGCGISGVIFHHLRPYPRDYATQGRRAHSRRSDGTSKRPDHHRHLRPRPSGVGCRGRGCPAGQARLKITLSNVSRDNMPNLGKQYT